MMMNEKNNNWRSGFTMSNNKIKFYRGESCDFGNTACVPTIFRKIDQKKICFSESKYYISCFNYLSNLAFHNSDYMQKYLKTIVGLSYMQHYGLETRLLDVTKDINVATYFACCSEFYKDGFVYKIKEAKRCKNKTAKCIERKIDFIFNNSKVDIELEKRTREEVLSKNVILDYKEIFKTNISNIRYLF